MKDHLEALQKLSRLQFELETQRLSPILQRESDLQNALLQLKAKPTDVAPDVVDLHRRLGIATAWQSWAGERARILNMELAQTRAQKEQTLQGVRKAFGRMEAANALFTRQK